MSRQNFYLLCMLGFGFAQPLPAAAQECSDGSEPAYWVAPMDPDFRRDAPGKSPMGMDLVPHCEHARDNGADVSINPTVVQNLGVKTAVVKKREFGQPILAVGQVGWDESRLQKVTARAAGWIEELGVHATGDRVDQDGLLYALYSPELYAAEAEFLAAAGQPLLRQAADQRLRALGYEPEQLEALTRSGQASERRRVRAKSDARVKQLNVRSGQYVTPSMPLMTLGDLSRVWVIAQLPERDTNRVFMGQQAEIKLPALAGESRHASVVHIHPELDAKTRNVRVRLQLDNPDRLIKPGMFASVNFQLKAASGLSVPSQAIIRTASGDRVIRALGEGHFDVVPVKIGDTAQAYTQITRGLAEGDEVVISGQFLLDSEANISAEMLRMRSEPQAATGKLTQGRVVGLDRQRRFITLDHDDIESLAMPAMVMSFDLAPQIELEDIQPGDSVLFSADKLAGGDYRITQLEAQP